MFQYYYMNMCMCLCHELRLYLLKDSFESLHVPVLLYEYVHVLMSWTTAISIKGFFWEFACSSTIIWICACAFWIFVSAIFDRIAALLDLEVAFANLKFCIFFLLMTWRCTYGIRFLSQVFFSNIVYLWISFCHTYFVNCKWRKYNMIQHDIMLCHKKFSWTT